MVCQTSLEGPGCSTVICEIAGVNLTWDMVHTTMFPWIVGRAKTSSYLTSSGVPVGENKFIFSTMQKLSNILKLSGIWNKDELFLGCRMVWSDVRGVGGRNGRGGLGLNRCG